jgi:1,4-dihydroxy-2-naphthoyl-CoA synthase
MRMGVVNRVVETDDLERETARITDHLCVLDPTVVAANKASVNSWWVASSPPS